MKVLNALLLMLPLMAYAGDQGLTKIDKSSVYASHELGKMSLYHNGAGFVTKQQGKYSEVGSHCLDNTLRNMKPAHLSALLKAGYITANKTNDGEVMLRANINGKGGGVWGAWAGAWIGKVAIHGAAQLALAGASGVVSLVATPVAGAIFYNTWAATVASSVEIASNTAAIGCAIALGTATGPV